MTPPHSSNADDSPKDSVASRPTATTLVDSLRELDCRSEQYAAEFLNVVLPAARLRYASDVHLQPTSDGLALALRMDGVLQPLGVFPSGEVTDVVTRLKVMASLLTYRTDLPQEGRIREQQGVEMRVSTFPTLHGERATVRLFTSATSLERLNDLGYSTELSQWLRGELLQTSGAVLITGPAGSGKTTTLYACLRELTETTQGSRCIITMEDPIESAIAGVAQTQVHEAAGLTLATGIRSLVRQDPEVMMVGEIRDAESARAAIGAALTGHLMLTSFHAGSCFNALQRLSDMGLEPYMLRNGIAGIVNQRLARRLCDRCASPISGTDTIAHQWGIEARTAHEAKGCELCLGTGYSGRIVFAEWLPLRGRPLSEDVFRGDLDDESSADLLSGGLCNQARLAVETGLTSPQEVRRVLG